LPQALRGTTDLLFLDGSPGGQIVKEPTLEQPNGA
jgi:hypothetical protein